jgi:AcrR family transcriptional regulator
MVTVNAIFEATIQVLLAEGVQRLTTTRVAARAGVSVGTLYQYYPQKQALLHAVLERHLHGVVEAVEGAARQSHGRALELMVESVVQAFLKAKLERPEEARALYAVASEVGAAALVTRAGARAGAALAVMLATASDARFEDPALCAYMLTTAMAGPTKGILEGQAPAQFMPVAHRHVVSLCLGYLAREAKPRRAPKPPRGPRAAATATVPRGASVVKGTAR